MLPRVTGAGPWEQSFRFALLLLLAVTALAGAGWLLSHVRLVPADSQAVVLRFGALDRVEPAGLLLAWPSPIEEVVMVPAGERVAELRIDGLQRDEAALHSDDAGALLRSMGDRQAGSGYLFTGDLGVVHLAATVYYRVVDARSFVLQGEHVRPALDRAVSASALQLSAERDLDTILVTRSITLHGDAALRRERLRAELVEETNRRLAGLAERGAGLGVQVVRIDLVSSLPRAAVSAFNAVLTADQQAEHAVAQARTDAVLTRQRAQVEAQTLLATARARASERVASAKSETSEILALAPQWRAGTDPELLTRLYRNRIQTILAKAGQVTTVDPSNQARLIVPGGGAR